LPIAAALTTGATVSTVIEALAWEPPDPTAYTVCAPWVVPAGIVTDVVALPAAPIVLGVVEPVSSVPAGESRRNCTVSPVTKFAKEPGRVDGRAVIAAEDENENVGLPTTAFELQLPSEPVQALRSGVIP
jgi:hypothetical protein